MSKFNVATGLGQLTFLTLSLIILLVIGGMTSFDAFASTDIEQDIEVFCEIYSPDTWNHLPDDASKYETIAEIKRRTQESLHTKAVQEAVSASYESNYSDYYAGVHARLSNLLGKEWQCENFKDFYRPKVDVARLNLSGSQSLRLDPNDSSKVYIELLDESVLIDRAPLRKRSISLIKQALEQKLSQKTEKPIGAVIFVSNDTGYGEVENVIGVLRDLAFSDVYLVLDTKEE